MAQLTHLLGIVSYYLSAFLDTAGIQEGKPQMNVALGMNAVQIVFAGLGASIVDKVGRRPMLLTVNIVCGLCWVGIIVPASIANVKDDKDKAAAESVAPSVSQAMLAWVYLFQIAYSVGWTPLQALLPVEVLSYEMRAKGMAFSSFFMSCGTFPPAASSTRPHPTSQSPVLISPALMANQFGVPVALKNIRWMTYIVFCVWCFVQTAILYFLVPETKGRTVSTTPLWRLPSRPGADPHLHSSRSSTTSSPPRAPSRPRARRSCTRSTPTTTSSTSTTSPRLEGAAPFTRFRGPEPAQHDRCRQQPGQWWFVNDRESSCFNSWIPDEVRRK
jgi:MFS family permease